VERATIDPLPGEIPPAAMPAFYAAVAVPKTTAASKIASAIARAGGSTLSPVAAGRHRGPSVCDALPTLAAATVSVLSTPRSDRGSSSPAPGTTFVGAPVAAPSLASSSPSAFAAAASTLGLMSSVLAGGAHGLFVPPTAPAPPVPAPTTVPLAAPAEQTVPPAALALTAPAEKTVVAAFEALQAAQAAAATGSFLLPPAAPALPAPAPAVVPQATQAEQAAAAAR
jgi:hypothetical protein